MHIAKSPDHLTGKRVVGHGARRQAKPKQMDPDRVCRAKGCKTVLSIYNRGSKCFEHSPVTFPRSRGVLPERRQSQS